METETGFNLEQAVAKWRDALAAEPGITDDNLRELESHLVESISRRVECGSTEQSAFAGAVRELGPHEQIVIEHTKENPGTVWQHRAFWMALAALLVPSMFRLLSILLGLVVHWIPNTDYFRHFEVIRTILDGHFLFVLTPALCIGILVSLCFSEKLRFRDLFHWLTNDRLRLLVLVACPVILYLSAYVVTDHAASVGRWLRNCGIGLGVFLGIVWLVGQFGHRRARHFLTWVLASRLRLVGVLVLSLAPSCIDTAPFLLSNVSTQAAMMLKLGAGALASTHTIQLLLIASIILLHPTVLRRRIPDTHSHPSSIERVCAVPDKVWRQRVFWMCTGCLLFFAWGIVDRGFHEVLTREIGRWWIRALIGVVVPIAVFSGLKRFAVDHHQLLGSVARVFGRTLTIVVSTLVLAAVHYNVTKMSFETAAGLWGYGPYASFNVILNWVTSLIWPGAMLGFLFWLRTRFHSEPHKPALRQQ